VRVSVTVIAEHNGRREVGTGGGGGRFGLGYFQDAVLESYVDQAVNAALTTLEARPAPAGERTVVLGPGWPPSTTWCWWRAPTARAPPMCARWCACR
jgi:TldD protein